MNEKIEIGSIILKRRKEIGLTQKQLAEKLCVTDKAISNWEQGKNYPDIALFESLANELGIEMTYMLGIGDSNPEMVVKELSAITKEQREETKKEKTLGTIILTDLITNFLIFSVVLLIIGKEPEFVIPSAICWLVIMSLPMYFEFMYFFFLSRGKQPYIIRTIAILWCSIKIIIIIVIITIWIVGGVGPDYIFKDVVDLFRNDYPSWKNLFKMLGY